MANKRKCPVMDGPISDGLDYLESDELLLSGNSSAGDEYNESGLDGQFDSDGVLPDISTNLGAVFPFTLENQPVSLYVLEHLGLEVGQQRNLVCAMGLFTSDNVKLIARVIRELFGVSFVPKLKYALVAPDVQVVDRLTGSYFDVDIRQFTRFYSVLSVELRSEDDDVYQNFPAKTLYP